MAIQHIISKSAYPTLPIHSLFDFHAYAMNRRLDPVFAISIGLAAAFTRINREEKEKGRSTQQSVDVFKRRWNLAWQSKEGEKGKL
jgi:hypothetical protein